MQNIIVVLIDGDPYRRMRSGCWDDIRTYKIGKNAEKEARWLKSKRPQSKIEVATITFENRREIEEEAN